MSVQTTYNYAMPRGVAGSLYDLSNYDTDSRMNASANGAMLFGTGVITGATPGTDVRVPAEGDTAAKFEGVALNSFTEQHDLDGEISVRKGTMVSVMRYGRVWARIPSGITPAFGDALYLIVSGDDAGKFTNASADTAVVLKGRFVGGKGTDNVAPIELYHQAQA